MNELSLYSGCGGGLIGTKLLGFNHIGYVEYYDYCQRVIAQRIKDGILDNAPIYGDIRTFIDSGRCELYRGVTDIITAGFPCQPFSVCGHRKGESDERNLWPETLETICRVRPRNIFLENVPGLINNEYLRRILGDLAEIFPNIRGSSFGNKECGQGIGNSERLWIFATEANCSMLESMDFQKYQIINQEESFRRQYTGAISAMLSQDDYTAVKRNSNAVTRGMDRLKAIGNMQIPEMAATAFHLLAGSE